MHGHAAVSDKHEKKYRMTECRRETRKERAVGWKPTWDNASSIPLPRPKTQNKIPAGVIRAHRAGGRIPMNFKVCSNLDTWERSREADIAAPPIDVCFTPFVSTTVMSALCQ